MSETNEPMPPLEPGNELRLERAEDFIAECLEALRSLKTAQSLALGKGVATYNPKWGDVWRADFDVSLDSVQPLVNRIVCWRHNGIITVMLAIGQNVRPL